MKKREFQYDIQRSTGSNIIRLHRHIRSIDPAHKPAPASVARRQSANFWKGRKWKH